MVEVRETLARWLLKEGLIGVGDVTLSADRGTKSESGVQLSPEVVSKLQSGSGVLDVLLNVLPDEVANSYSGLRGNMKAMESPLARLFNWNLLTPVLSAAGIELDVDRKALIVAGDTQAVLLVLTELVGGKDLILGPDREDQLLFGHKRPVADGGPAAAERRSHEVVEPLLEEPVNIASPPPSVRAPASKIQVQQTHVQRAPLSVPSVMGTAPSGTGVRRSMIRESLETVAVETLTEVLSITKDEASRNFLSDGGVGLKRLLTTSSPVSGSRDALAALDALIGAVHSMGPWSLPQTDKRAGLPTFLTVIAHGLGSPLEGVPSRSCFLLEQAFNACESQEQLKPVLYEWIVSPLRAGPSILIMLHLNKSGAHNRQQNHNSSRMGSDARSESSAGNGSIESDIASMELSNNVRALSSLLVRIGDAGRLASFLERDLRQLCSGGPVWFMEALSRLVPSFAGQGQLAAELMKESIPGVMTMALQMCEADDDKERRAAVDVLSGMWAAFPQAIEEKVEVSLCRSALAMLKRACRDAKESVRLATYRGLLRLLESFVAVGSEHGTVVYKILIFTIIEHANDYGSRRQLLMGLGSILDRHEGMPVGVFVEPLVKQITRMQSQFTEGNRDKPSTSVSELDAEFLLNHIVRHPQLTTLHASLLLKLLANSGISFPETISWCREPLQLLAKRFCMEPSCGTSIQQVCHDFVSQMDRYVSRQEMEACSVLSKFMQTLFPFVLSHGAQRMLKDSFSKWNGVIKSQNASHSNEVMFEMMAKVLEDLPSNHIVGAGSSEHHIGSGIEMAQPMPNTSHRYKHPVDEMLNRHRRDAGTPTSVGTPVSARNNNVGNANHGSSALGLGDESEPDKGGIRSLHMASIHDDVGPRASSRTGGSRLGNRSVSRADTVRTNDDELALHRHEGARRGRTPQRPASNASIIERSMSVDSSHRGGGNDGHGGQLARGVSPSPSTVERMSRHRRKISYSELSDVSKKERQRKDARLRKERQQEIEKIRLRREALKAEKVKAEEMKRREMERREAARRKRNENLLLQKQSTSTPTTTSVAARVGGGGNASGGRPTGLARGPGGATSSIEDELILEALNRRLARNPQTVMPPGFEKKLVVEEPSDEDKAAAAAMGVETRKVVRRTADWTKDGVLTQLENYKRELMTVIEGSEEASMAAILAEAEAGATHREDVASSIIGVSVTKTVTKVNVGEEKDTKERTDGGTGTNDDGGAPVEVHGSAREGGAAEDATSTLGMVSSILGDVISVACGEEAGVQVASTGGAQVGGADREMDERPVDSLAEVAGDVKVATSFEVEADDRLLRATDDIGEEGEGELCAFLLAQLQDDGNLRLPFGFEAIEESVPGAAEAAAALSAPIEKYIAVRKVDSEISVVSGTPRPRRVRSGQVRTSRQPQSSFGSSGSAGMGSEMRTPSTSGSSAAPSVRTPRSGVGSLKNKSSSDRQRSLSAGAAIRRHRSTGISSTLAGGSDGGDSGGSSSTPLARRAVPFAEQAIRKFLRDYAETLIISLADKCDRRQTAGNSGGSRSSGINAHAATPSSAGRSAGLRSAANTPQRSRSAETVRRHYPRTGSSPSSSSGSMSARRRDRRDQFGIGGSMMSGGTPTTTAATGGGGGMRGPMGVDFSYLRQRREQEKLALVEQRRKQEARRSEQMRRDREHAEQLRQQVEAYREQKRRREDEALQKRRADEKAKKERARAAAEVERKRREEDKKKLRDYYSRVQAEQEQKRRNAEEELRQQEERRREALKEYKRRKAREQEKENNPVRGNNESAAAQQRRKKGAMGSHDAGDTPTGAGGVANGSGAARRQKYRSRDAIAEPQTPKSSTGYASKMSRNVAAASMASQEKANGGTASSTRHASSQEKSVVREKVSSSSSPPPQPSGPGSDTPDTQSDHVMEEQRSLEKVTGDASGDPSIDNATHGESPGDGDEGASAVAADASALGESEKNGSDLKEAEEFQTSPPAPNAMAPEIKNDQQQADAAPAEPIQPVDGVDPENEDETTVTPSEQSEPAPEQDSEPASSAAAAEEPVVKYAAAEPEATEPEVTEPEVTEPEATEPEATESEAPKPEAPKPEATEPEATEPEADSVAQESTSPENP